MGAIFRYMARAREDAVRLIRELPEGQTGEYASGELKVSPRPPTPHGFAELALGAALLDAFQRGRDGPGGWWILVEPELHLGSDILVPDVAAWRRERLPAIPATPALSIAPDFVCEILSPSTAAFDRARKLPAYARAGVGHAWLLDPLARTLEILRTDAGRWILLAVHAGSEQPRAEPFEAVPLRLEELWLPGPAA